MTWTAQIQSLAAGRGIQFTLVRDGTPATYADILSAWSNDPAFCSWFSKQLATVPFSAFRWETPAVTTQTLDRPFEFVVLDSPGPASRPDRNAFAKHFTNDTGDGVVSFANLGRDATLVVPCPLGPDSAYGHLASFVRHAPMAQQIALWKHVAEAMHRRINDVPLWLSTAGAGVSWLHVRLDDRPKYYGHQPYRIV